MDNVRELIFRTIEHFRDVVVNLHPRFFGTGQSTALLTSSSSSSSSSKEEEEGKKKQRIRQKMPPAPEIPVLFCFAGTRLSACKSKE